MSRYGYGYGVGRRRPTPGSSNLVDYFTTRLVAQFEARVAASVTDAGGGAVSAWADLSGNAKHATQTTAGSRPTYVATDAAFSGKACLSFAADYLIVPSLTFGASTIVVVAAQSAAGGYMFARTGDLDNIYGQINSTLYAAGRGVGAASSKNHPSGASWAVSATGRVITTRMDGTHAGHTMRIDGVDAGLTTVGAGNPSTASASGTCGIGGTAAGGFLIPATGKISAVFVINEALTGADLTYIETYAAGCK